VWPVPRHGMARPQAQLVASLGAACGHPARCGVALG
jgi:hypothetical protein